MNIILFDLAEVGRPIAADDPRAAHVLEVLRRRPGDDFDAGIYDGPRGKGRVVSVVRGQVHWAFEPRGSSEPLDPIELVIGLPRPQTARKILQEAAALGVRAIRFAISDKTEAGYARSALWTSGEWMRHVRAGVAQAFSTRVPAVSYGMSLDEALPIGDRGTAVALDNYEAAASLASAPLAWAAPATVVIGAERGWSAEERDLLRTRGVSLVHLGKRVLRTETACVAAVALVKARLGLY